MNCCVPFCVRTRCSSFGVPKNEREKWEKSLGIKLKNSSRVCKKHFKSEDIITEWVSGSGFNKYSICFKRPKLRVGAVPTISLTPLLCDSNLLTTSHEPDTLETISISETICAKNDELNLFEKEKNVKDIQNDHCYHSSYSHMSSSVVPESTFSSKLKTSPLLSKRKKTLEIKPATALFINILKNIKLVSLPSKWYAHFDFVRGITNDLILGFHQLSSFGDGFQRSIKKQIVMTKDSTLHIHVYGSKVTMEDIGIASNKPKNIEELVNIIKHVDKVKVCERSVSINNFKNIQSTFGSQFIQSYQWRHTNCSIILDNDSKRNVCKWCKRLSSKVENKLQSSDIVYISPSKRKRIENLQKTKDQIKKKYPRAAVKLSKLKNNLNNKKNKRKETSHINLSSTLESSNIQK